MDKLKYYFIVLDGIDKVGKDTIASYIWNLDKRLNILCRGYPSLETYNMKFDRNVEYALPDKNTVFIHLTVDKPDWDIRCKLTNEPEIDYHKDASLFQIAFKKLIDNNYIVKTYNTSHSTAYDIADSIVKFVHLLNKEA